MEMQDTKLSLKTAYSSKIKYDEKFKKFLIELGDNEIIYVNDNTVLGKKLVNPELSEDDPKNYTGENYIGNLIMQLRKSQIKDKQMIEKRESDKKMLIMIYYNYIFLKQQISKDNDLDKFIDVDVRKEFLNKQDKNKILDNTTTDIQYNKVIYVKF